MYLWEQLRCLLFNCEFYKSRLSASEENLVPELRCAVVQNMYFEVLEKNMSAF